MEDTLCNIYKAHANHHYKQRLIKQKQSMYIYIKGCSERNGTNWKCIYTKRNNNYKPV